MNKNQADTIKSLIRSAYQVENDYNKTDGWYVRFEKHDREFQIKSTSGIFFDVIEVGLGPHQLTWRIVFQSIDFLTMYEKIKIL